MMYSAYVKNACKHRGKQCASGKAEEMFEAYPDRKAHQSSNGGVHTVAEKHSLVYHGCCHDEGNLCKMCVCNSQSRCCGTHSLLCLPVQAGINNCRRHLVNKPSPGQVCNLRASNEAQGHRS